MGTVFKASSRSADAPKLDTGWYDARFEGTQPRLVLGGQYGDGTIFNSDGSVFDGAKPESGKQFNRLAWVYTPLDDDGAVLYPEDGRDPIELEILTNMGFNVTSKTKPKEVRCLEALMTDEEFAAFVEGKGADEDSLKGRIVQVEVFMKESGWPGISQTIRARKKRSRGQAE